MIERLFAVEPVLAATLKTLTSTGLEHGELTRAKADQ